MMGCALENGENIVGKGKMLVTSMFLFSIYVHKVPLSQGRLNLGVYGKGLKVV